jgi:magnesium chelatase subunit H
MTPARTSRAEPLRFVIVTLDHHVASALQRARERLREELPGLVLTLHAASDFHDPRAAKACTDDIARADIVFANMLFLEEHINVVAPALAARRSHCDAVVCAMSAGEIMRQTRMGGFTMDGSSKGGPLALLKKLRGQRGGSAADGGAGQLKMLKRLPKLLRFIPGTAQDVRAYFLTLSYWLAGSSDNLADLVRALINRYADGPRKVLRGSLQVSPPREYPEEGLYHPRAPTKIVTEARSLPPPRSSSSSTSSSHHHRNYH